MTEGQVLALISSLAVLALVGASLIARQPQPSLILKSVLGWIGIAIVIAILVAFRSELSWFINDIGARLGMANQRIEGGAIRVPRDGDGHYYVVARINGVERRMLIDTGATTTALSRGTAVAAGIELAATGPCVQVDTAIGGRVMVGPMQRIADLDFT